MTKPSKSNRSKIRIVRIGIDTGGTFTDFVVSEGAKLRSFKLLSSPQNPAIAIISGLQKTMAEDAALRIADIVHGTTVATNTLLERKGAVTALITTKGFEDILEIGRQTRPELYNLSVQRPDPLVPVYLRFGLDERVSATGEALKTASAEEIARLVAAISSAGVESIALSMLFSFSNPINEEAVVKALEKLKLPLSVSSRILPEYREYERASTIIVNAYVAPKMAGYLSYLKQAISDEFKERFYSTRSESVTRQNGPSSAGDAGRRIPLRVMQSNGGTINADTAGSESVRTILSGPAGGVVAAYEISCQIGIEQIITFDMGGTSTDVSLSDGQPRVTNEAVLAGHPISVPVLDIHTVGAGGGSIAHVDSGGALRVGPESAGADPGPACYGRGEQPTVTDANLVLGRFGSGGLLGGTLPLDHGRAEGAIDRLADDLSKASGRKVTRREAALGVIHVVNISMENALRVVSVARGYDPRRFTLVSFGGAGGLHAGALALGLRIPQILIPATPGALSALGVLLAEVIKDYSRTIVMSLAGQAVIDLNSEFASLEQRARKELAADGFDSGSIRFHRTVSLRYKGQSFELNVPWGRRMVADFHVSHKRQYGYSDEAREVELVAIRVRATGIVRRPKLAKNLLQKRYRPGYDAKVKLVMEKSESTIPEYDRENLRPGAMVDGPALIREYGSTTLVLPGSVLHVDELLNLLINAGAVK